MGYRVLREKRKNLFFGNPCQREEGDLEERETEKIYQGEERERERSGKRQERERKRRFAIDGDL